MVDYLKMYSTVCTLKAKDCLDDNISVRLINDEKERTSLVNDDLFQLMMNNRSRMKYPCMLLSLMFNLDYGDLLKEARFYKEFVDRGTLKSKKEIADCMIVYKDTLFNIEMNGTNTLMRNQDYIHRAATIKNVRGKRKYETMNYCQVNLNNFRLEGHDKIFEVYQPLDREGDLYGYQTFVNVFLLNLRDKYYNEGVKSLNKWERYVMGLVETSKTRISELKKGSRILMEYDEELNKMWEGEVDLPDPIDKHAEMVDIIVRKMKNNSKREILEEGFIEGHAKGHFEGRQEGKLEGKLEGKREGRLEGEIIGEARAYEAVARHLLSRGMTLDMIADYTNMPISKVENLCIRENED